MSASQLTGNQDNVSTRRQSLQLLRELAAHAACMDEAVGQLDGLLVQQGEELASDAFESARAVIENVAGLKERIRFAIDQAEATEIGRRRK